MGRGRPRCQSWGRPARAPAHSTECPGDRGRRSPRCPGRSLADAKPADFQGFRCGMAHAVRTAHGRPGRPVTKEARMDLWYELAIREMGALNGEVTEMLKDAETA